MFVEKDAGLESIAADVAELKRLVAEYSRASGKKRKELVESVRKHVSVGYVNYSEFGSFVNACDSNEDEVVSDPELLERILDLYVRNRDVSYPDPRETEFSKRWIQAMLDKGSSRKKGKLGERKIGRTLERLGYVQAKTLSDFTNERFCFADFERDGEFSMKNVNAFFGTKFGEGTQNKMLDVLIRSGDDFYFMEAKHMNTA